jgi:endoglucanase
MKSALGIAGFLALVCEAAAQCNGTFVDLTAAEFIERANPAWNLGNTLDAIPNEGSWNNPPVEASTFDTIKAAGFRSVRIPVTYTHHFLNEGPDYEVDPAWLQRVSDVVDFALERDLLVVTNVHHDSWEWADVSQPAANVTEIQTKFRALWVQIGNTLACKPSTVALESINEPPAETAEHGATVNEFNRLFLDALAETGGWNTRRVVTLAGGNNDCSKTSQWFEPPAEIANPWALQVHYYSPYDFTFSAWGKTIWGSDEDKAAVDSELGVVRGNFTDVPIYVGEFDASPINTEAAARWKWFDYVVRAMADIGAAVAVWDNGLDHLDRETDTFRDQTSIDIILNAVTGIPSSLPGSTVDPGAANQSSSAYIFHRVGDPIEDEELPYLFNGNDLDSITASDGTELAAGTDYTVGESSVTFTADLVRLYIASDSEPGVYETFTLTFSAGASTTVELVQWDTPVLASTNGTATTGSNLVIPVEWKGLERLATVKFLAEDGTYLVDDWTQYLGPLQQARGVSEAPTHCNMSMWWLILASYRPMTDSGALMRKVSLFDLPLLILSSIWLSL